MGGMIGAIGRILGSVLVLTVSDRLKWCGVFLLGFLAGGSFPDQRVPTMRVEEPARQQEWALGTSEGKERCVANLDGDRSCQIDGRIDPYAALLGEKCNISTHGGALPDAFRPRQ